MTRLLFIIETKNGTQFFVRAASERSARRFLRRYNSGRSNPVKKMTGYTITEEDGVLFPAPDYDDHGYSSEAGAFAV